MSDEIAMLKPDAGDNEEIQKSIDKARHYPRKKDNLTQNTPVLGPEHVNENTEEILFQALRRVFSNGVTLHEMSEISPSECNSKRVRLAIQPQGSKSTYKVDIWQDKRPDATRKATRGILRPGRIRLAHSARVQPRIAGKRALLSLSELQTQLNLSESECQDIRCASRRFPMKIPRHYSELMKEYEVLREIVVPSMKELITHADDQSTDVHADESKYQPVEGIVHRYHGKLLFFPTLQCFGHCRFCFRSEHRVRALSREEIDIAIAYVRRNKEIREVIVTGGDPLTLPIEKLDDILARLRAINHVELIRIGTRALAYQPQVISREMVNMLASYKPVYMALSFVHPGEISPCSEEKLNMLADAGIVMLQQGPILKKINDDPSVLRRLYEKLAKNRVVAYYAIYGIYAPGVRHFIVNRNEVSSLFKNIENQTSGHCLPHLITLDQNEDKTRSVL